MPGLHYFGLFFPLFLWTCLPEKAGGEGKPRIFYLGIGVICLTYAGLAIVFQRVFFHPEDLLSKIYLGSPLYAHVTWDFVIYKLRAHASVLYVSAPLGVALGFFLLRRDILTLVGPLSTVPWLVLSFFAPSFLASLLTSYYGFPVLVGILWPAVVYRIRGERPSYLIDLFLVTALSTILFVAGARWNHDNEPWKNFGFNWIGKIGINQSALEELFLNHQPAGRFAVDDAVAALVPELISRENWRFGLAWSDGEIHQIETFIFQPATWQAGKSNALLKQASLDRVCRLGRSNFFVATRTAQSFPSCRPVVP